MLSWCFTQIPLALPSESILQLCGLLTAALFGGNLPLQKGEWGLYLGKLLYCLRQ